MSNKEKDQFKKRFNVFQIDEAELERMFKQEELRIRSFEVNEAAFQAAMAKEAMMQMGYGAGGGASQTTPTPTSEFVEATLIYWEDATTGTWKFFVHNYGTNISSDIVDTGLDYTDFTSGNVLNSYIIEQDGFSWQADSTATSATTVFCVSSDGTVIDSFTYPAGVLRNRKNFEYLTHVWFWVDGGQTNFRIFNGTSLGSASLPSAISSLAFNSGGGETSKNRTVSFKVNGNTTYVLTAAGDLIDVTSQVGNNYENSTSLQSDFLAFINEDVSNVPQSVVIVNEDGTIRNTFDLAPYSITNISESSTYGENQWAGTFKRAGVEWIYVKYDYTGNTFSVETLSITNYPNYSEVQDFRETVDDFVNSRPNSVIYLYGTSPTANWGADYSYLAFMWSIGSGEIHKEVVNNGTAREVFIGSTALYSQHPNFLIGPVGGTGPIEIGILRATGEIDFSNTGQLSEDCGGVSVILIGNTTVYAFYTNSGDTRFEFWNTSQVTTHDVVGTLNWNFYVNGSVIVAINGDDYNDSFWFTENSPTVNAMPTLANVNVNSGMSWGTLTGVEDSKLIFWENNTNGEAFNKLYTLTNEEGLSTEITGNNTSNGIDIDLERGVFNWLYADPTSDNIIISQYSLSTGLLLSSVDTGETSISGNESYGIRSFAWKDDTPTVGSITLWMQGPSGTTTTVIETTNWGYMHNDSYWEDNDN
jgi:hypothetical protein